MALLSVVYSKKAHVSDQIAFWLCLAKQGRASKLFNMYCMLLKNACAPQPINHQSCSQQSALLFQVSKEEAEQRIRAIQEPYKLEILDSIVARHPTDPITIYHLGKEGEGEHWWDLCAGPHVESTKKLNPAAVELESIAGVDRRSVD